MSLMHHRDVAEVPLEPLLLHGGASLLMKLSPFVSLPSSSSRSATEDIGISIGRHKIVKDSYFCTMFQTSNDVRRFTFRQFCYSFLLQIFGSNAS